MPKFKFENGEGVRDTVTGYSGTVMGRADYMTGCIQYAVCARKLDKDGLPKKWQWFDEERIERYPKTAKKVKRSKGGPQHGY